MDNTETKSHTQTTYFVHFWGYCTGSWEWDYDWGSELSRINLGST